MAAKSKLPSRLPSQILCSLTLGEVIDVICNGESTGSISVIGSGGTAPYEYTIDGDTYQTSNTFTNLPAGTYTIAVLDAMGCAVDLEATITEPLPLIVDAGPDQTIDLGFSTDIRATVSEFPVTFEWIPADFLSCIDCIDPEVIMPPNTTTYTITVTNSDGCTAMDDVTITVVKNRPIYIPNAFSPNDDGDKRFFHGLWRTSRSPDTGYQDIQPVGRACF